MAVLSFVQVPKTAGKSICDALGLVFPQHIRASERDGWKFTFVRDPYERLRSAYDFAKYGPQESRNAAVKNWQTFEAFVLGRGWERGGCEHFWPMTHWIDAPVDFIGRYENIENDFIRLCETLGMTRRPLPRLHSVEAPPVTWSAEMRRIVREAYSEDFERFNYA